MLHSLHVHTVWITKTVLCIWLLHLSVSTDRIFIDLECMTFCSIKNLHLLTGKATREVKRLTARWVKYDIFCSPDCQYTFLAKLWVLRTFIYLHNNPKIAFNLLRSAFLCSMHVVVRLKNKKSFKRKRDLSMHVLWDDTGIHVFVRHLHAKYRTRAIITRSRL